MNEELAKFEKRPRPQRRTRRSLRRARRRRTRLPRTRWRRGRWQGRRRGRRARRRRGRRRRRRARRARTVSRRARWRAPERERKEVIRRRRRVTTTVSSDDCITDSLQPVRLFFRLFFVARASSPLDCAAALACVACLRLACFEIQPMQTLNSVSCSCSGCLALQPDLQPDRVWLLRGLHPVSMAGHVAYFGQAPSVCAALAYAPFPSHASPLCAGCRPICSAAHASPSAWLGARE